MEGYIIGGTAKQFCHSFLRKPNIFMGIQHFNIYATISGKPHGESMSTARQELLAVYRESILTLDGQGILAKWQRTETQWFLPKWLGQNRIAKLMGQLAVNKTSISKDEIPDQLNLIIKFKNEKDYVEARLPQLLPLLGRLWQDWQTDWPKATAMVTTVLELERNLSQCGARTQATQIRSRLALDMAEDRLNYQSFARFNTAYQALAALQTELSRLLKIDLEAIQAENTDWFSYAALRTAAWTANLDGLREWCAWIATRQKAVAAGLGPLVIAYESGGLENGEVVAAFEKGLYKAGADYIIAREPALNLFSGKLFEEKIRQFRQTNDYFEELTRREIYARLAAKIPNFVQEASQSSELGILQRAIKSNGRALSVRKLFEQIPNLLPRLSPWRNILTPRMPGLIWWCLTRLRKCRQ